MTYLQAKPLRGINRVLSQSPILHVSWPLIIGVLSAIGVLVFSRYQTLGDPDTFLHLRIGQWIIDHFTIPRVDLFSHSLVGEKWIAHEWLSGVILATIYRLGGWGGLVLLVAACLSITLAYLMGYLQKRVPPIYAIFFTGLTFFAVSTHLLARPHILVWPLLVIWVGTLITAQEQNRRPPFLLIGLMILWVNLHGSFIFGIAIILPIALEAIILSPAQLRRSTIQNWLVFFVIASLACLINPQGFAGAIFPLQILNLQHLGAIHEWMPYQFKGINPLEILLFTYFILALLGLLRLPIIRIVMVVGLVHMALTHNRYVSILGLVSPLLIARSFGQSYDEKFKNETASRLDPWFLSLTGQASTPAIVLSLLFIGTTALWTSHLGRYSPPQNIEAKAAIDAYQSLNHPGPGLNDYRFGGALIYRDIPVFIDGRADLYDKKVMEPYIEAMIDGKASAIEKIIHEYQITWALLSPDSSAVAYFDTKTNWQRYYSDSNAVIYVLKATK